MIRWGMCALTERTSVYDVSVMADELWKERRQGRMEGRMDRRNERTHQQTIWQGDGQACRQRLASFQTGCGQCFMNLCLLSSVAPVSVVFVVFSCGLGTVSALRPSAVEMLIGAWHWNSRKTEMVNENIRQGLCTNMSHIRWSQTGKEKD